MVDILLLAAGFVLLIAGGELLVRGASTLAERLGMSQLLIGITLVGFGTSMPELATSIQASLAGAPGIAIGNIVGSNIANILLILGVASIIAPMAVTQMALRRDGMVVLASAVLFAGLGFVMPLDRLVGAVLFSGLVAYLYYAYRQESAGALSGHTAAYEKMEGHDEAFARKDGNADAAARDGSRGLLATLIPLAIAIAGLVIIIGGAKLLVDAATSIARAANVSEAVIGLTIVAIGTSLPELVTSVIAAFRQNSDVAIGNVLGSNVYNILGIGGVTALIAPTTIPEQIVHFDSLVMVGVSIGILVMARNGYRIGRLDGTLLLAGYAAYLFVLWPK